MVANCQRRKLAIPSTILSCEASRSGTKNMWRVDDQRPVDNLTVPTAVGFPPSLNPVTKDQAARQPRRGPPPSRAGEAEHGLPMRRGVEPGRTYCNISVCRWGTSVIESLIKRAHESSRIRATHLGRDFRVASRHVKNEQHGSDRRKNKSKCHREAHRIITG